jgi:hypothetical protein
LFNKNSAQPGRAFLVVNPPETLLSTLTPPDMVVISRKDLYDPHAVLAGFLTQNHFRVTATLPAFVVWEKPAAENR